MRRKLDFVTNSSTTSFIGWGVEIENSNIFKNELFLKRCFENYKTSKYYDVSINYEKFIEDKKNLRYNISDNFYSTILNFSFGCYGSDYIMIAASPVNMQDNQTLGDFKKEIISELASYGIIVKENELAFIEEAWRDG